MPTFFLTASQGEILRFWSNYEILAGVIIAIIVAAMASKVLFQKKSYRFLNPMKWILFLSYFFGPFLVALAHANIDVAYRVITGKINPGIVKISPGLKGDGAITMLANSITLTPGTLSVDIDEETNDLYIHWINVTNLKPSIEDICGTFPTWVRRITE